MTEPESSESQPSLIDLRRAQGEGWKWPRAMTEECPLCGYNAAALPPSKLGARAVELAGQWRQFLLAADEDHLRHIPEPGIFSPMQYGAHVRDILRLYGERVLLAMREDNPAVAAYNPPDDVWAGYNELDPADLTDDITTRAQRLDENLAELGPDDWSRTLTREALRSGFDPVVTFTIAGTAAYAVHETYHHLLDADGTLSRDRTQ